MDETLIIVYIDSIIKVLVCISLVLMIWLWIYQLINERHRKRLFKQLEQDRQGIERIMGKPWKEARRLLREENKDESGAER